MPNDGTERVRRVAALYDIHGNLPALEAVLAEADVTEADLIVVGGDIVSGPFPAATLDRLMALGERVRFIRGNADRELVARFDQGATPGDDDDDLGAAVAQWAARQIGRSHRDFLASLGPSLAVDISGLGPTLFCHGSPRSDEEIITAVTPESRLRPMLSSIAHQVVVCGHTHAQFDRLVSGTRVVNAGSVGMPYQDTPGAYWLLLRPEVDLRRTGYDLEAAAAQIRRSGIPDAEEFARDNVLRSPSAAEATAYFEQMASDQSGLPPVEK
jgi:predicted phosphodiesterase